MPRTPSPSLPSGLWSLATWVHTFSRCASSCRQTSERISPNSSMPSFFFFSLFSLFSSLVSSSAVAAALLSSRNFCSRDWVRRTLGRIPAMLISRSRSSLSRASNSLSIFVAFFAACDSSIRLAAPPVSSAAFSCCAQCATSWTTASLHRPTARHCAEIFCCSEMSFFVASGHLAVQSRMSLSTVEEARSSWMDSSMSPFSSSSFRRR
mmetsp:Transcript_4011/g.10349  ORF Transcript_4011/g.10349 Transcript_4011/m.10349 type:complete len:208 (+) Transcript_4011:2062-2685(+)